MTKVGPRRTLPDGHPAVGKRVPVAGYIRSPDIDDPRVAEWEREIRRHAAERGYDLAEMVRDQGVSGTASWKPGLESIVRGLRSGTIVGVVCPSTDHLGRPPATYVQVISQIHDATAWIAFLEERDYKWLI